MSAASGKSKAPALARMMIIRVAPELDWRMDATRVSAQEGEGWGGDRQVDDIAEPGLILEGRRPSLIYSRAKRIRSMPIRTHRRMTGSILHHPITMPTMTFQST